MERRRVPPAIHNPRRIFERPIPLLVSRFDVDEDNAVALRGYVLRPNREHQERLEERGN